jgi:hypothetical protein
VSGREFLICCSSWIIENMQPSHTKKIGGGGGLPGIRYLVRGAHGNQEAVFVAHRHPAWNNQVLFKMRAFCQSLKHRYNYLSWHKINLMTSWDIFCSFRCVNIPSRGGDIGQYNLWKMWVKKK